MLNELDMLIADIRAPQRDPIIAKQNERILDHLLLARSLIKERDEGIAVRAENESRN